MATTLNTNIDQEQIVAALQQELAQKDAWTDLLTTSTGQAILDFVATAGTFGVFAAERGLQEAFPDSARLQSSILSAMRQLGVRISRKLPASTTVHLTKPADGISVNIPAYTVFNGRGRKLYNRSPIIFGPSDVQQDVVLYEGYSKSIFTNGTGAAFQTFVSTEDKFTIADSDVRVSMSGVAIPIVTEGLWHYKATITGTGSEISVEQNPAVRDATTKNGELELTFGSSNYGTMPSSNQPLVISYCITTGAAGNDLTFSGAEIVVTGFDIVAGLSSAPLVGGADEKDPEVYKRIGPSDFAALDRAVNESEYNAVAAKYPGVIDAQLWGQRRLAPTLDTYMNLIRVSLLTSTPWTKSQKDDFIAWFSKRSMGYMRFFWSDPIARDYALDALVYCDSTADLAEVNVAVSNAVTAFTAAKFGFIGRSVYKSELYDAIKNAHQAVRYIRMKAPLFDVITAATPPMPIFSEEGVGTVPEGATTYFVTTVVTAGSSTGESLPRAIQYHMIQAGKNLRLIWDAVQGVDRFRIYATRGSSVGLLGEVPGSATEFIDTGAAVDTKIPVPQRDDMPVLYPQCTDVKLQFLYADDRGTGVR